MKKLLAGLLIGLGSLSIESSSAMDVNQNNPNSERRIVVWQPKDIKNPTMFNHCVRILGVKRLIALNDSSSTMDVNQNNPNSERRIVVWQPKDVSGFIHNPFFKSSSDCDFTLFIQTQMDNGEPLVRILEEVITSFNKFTRGVELTADFKETASKKEYWEGLEETLQQVELPASQYKVAWTNDPQKKLFDLYYAIGGDGFAVVCGWGPCNNQRNTRRIKLISNSVVNFGTHGLPYMYQVVCAVIKDRISIYVSNR